MKKERERQLKGNSPVRDPLRNSSDDMRCSNTHWEICGRDWSPAASSALWETGERFINRVEKQKLVSLSTSWNVWFSRGPTFLREGIAGWSTISVGDQTWVNANVLLPRSFENSFGPAGETRCRSHGWEYWAMVCWSKRHLTCFPWSLRSGGMSLSFPRSSWTTQICCLESCHSIRSSGRWHRRRRHPQLSPWCLRPREVESQLENIDL